MIFLRAKIKLETFKNPEPNVNFMDGLIYEARLLENVSFWFQSLLQILALYNPVVAKNVDTFADSIKSFKSSLVLFHY